MDDYGDGDSPPSPIKITAMNDDGDDGPLPPMPPGGSGGPDDADENYDYYNGGTLVDGDGNMEGEEDDDGDVDVLPDFANDEARERHAEIKLHKSKLDSASADLDETKNRLNVMAEHLKNIGQEVMHTTELVTAKKKEIETEDHLTQLVVREAGRYQQEFKRLTEANELSDEKLSVAQNGIFTGNAKMDQFKLEMNWNQEELEQWALAAKQKEDDNLALQKYTRADESKIKETTLLLEKLQIAVVEAKTKLENETTDTQARQIELDRTAEEFRRVHGERQVLVTQWQDTVEAMRRRDQTVQKLAEDYAHERSNLAKQVELLNSAREELSGIKDESGDIEARTTQLERMVQGRKGELMATQAKLQGFTDEMEALKNELQSSASALMRRRNENVTAGRLLEEKKATLVDARRKYQETKKALDDEKAAAGRTELSAKEAEDNLAAAELELKKKDLTVTAKKEEVFRQSQALFALRQDEAGMIGEISGAQSSSRNLQSKIRTLDQESLRQQELIYSAEFQIQQMERKVSRGLGERSDEETKALKKEIGGLEGEVEAAKEQKKMLVAQCRKLNFELRAAQRKKEVSETAAAELKEKIIELEKENVSFAGSLETLTRAKEEKMVQIDVLKLDVKRLRDALNSKADKVFSLENRKQQLNLSMEERKAEIAVHADVQRAQLKAAEDEKHRITVELGGRRLAVEKQRDKYETLCKVSGVRAGEDGGEPKSQAYYMIKAAQKREELQRAGDELDQDIRKMEKEIKALSATLKHLGVQNTSFRAAHQKVNLSGEDAERLRQLEQQSKASADALFQKKKALQRLQTDLEEDGRRLEQVTSQAARLRERNAHLSSARVQLDSELAVQREAVEKITRRVGRMTQSVRERPDAILLNTGGGGEESDENNSQDGQRTLKFGETLQEKDFRCEALTDTVTTALYTLGQLAEEYPEIKDTLTMRLMDSGLAVPERPASRTGPEDTLRPQSSQQVVQAS